MYLRFGMFFLNCHWLIFLNWIFFFWSAHECSQQGININPLSRSLEIFLTTSLIFCLSLVWYSNGLSFFCKQLIMPMFSFTVSSFPFLRENCSVVREDNTNVQRPREEGRESPNIGLSFYSTLLFQVEKSIKGLFSLLVQIEFLLLTTKRDLTNNVMYLLN